MFVAGIILVLISGLAFWLGPIIISEIRATKAAKFAVKSLSENDRNRLFQFIEEAGNAPSKGVIGLLVPDHLEQTQVAFILPKGIPDYPWEGNLVCISQAFDRKYHPRLPIKFVVSQPIEPIPPSRYRVDRYCAMPSLQRPNAKKASSVLSIDRMLKLSPRLNDLATQFHCVNPELFLATLLSPDGKGRHGNGFDEVRFGLSPQYLQEYRHHKCQTCK